MPKIGRHLWMAPKVEKINAKVAVSAKPSKVLAVQIKEKKRKNLLRKSTGQKFLY